MKKFILLLVALMIAIMSYAQNSGLGFNYQAVVRKTDGTLLANSDVKLRISLYPGPAAENNPTWVETHEVKTDDFGCFGIPVGNGTRESGWNNVAAKYSDINFAANYYWMKIEILEGSSYREVSKAQLPSSPYSEVAHNVSIFAGMIAPFAGPADKIPAGWLLCDGREVSRIEFINLYKAVGTCWGEGNGSTTFNLPDLRGMFLRGVVGANPQLDDNGNPQKDPDANSRTRLYLGGNTGNNVGSYQWDAIRNITGSFNGVDYAGIIHATGAFYPQEGAVAGSNQTDYDNGIVVFDASRVVPTGGDNRPKNAYVTYIIKY